MSPEVIAGNDHPINAKYWTGRQIHRRLGTNAGDASVTALETIMALVAVVERMPLRDPLLTVEDVAARLNVTKDWVWEQSSRNTPYLPVIRMSDGDPLLLKRKWKPSSTK